MRAEHIAGYFGLVGRRMTRTARLAVVAGPFAFGLAHAARVRAQTHAEDAIAKAPQFEVASVRPNNSSSGVPIIRPMLYGIRAKYCTLRMLIEWAYRPGRFFGDNEISGAPKWTDSDRYDVEARIDDVEASNLRKLDRDQQEHILEQMLQELLAERFKLTVHRESIEQPIYELVISKNGPKLKGGKPDDPEFPNGMLRMTNGQITAKGVSMGRLLDVLGRQVQRPVLDKTGLAGTYDFSLEWQPDSGLVTIPSGTGEGQREPLPSTDSFKPSIFIALQEQLGLRLKSAKGTGQVLVIDHVERPSAN
jgi:uncharacterized protein (TIGR03435 family)